MSNNKTFLAFLEEAQFTKEILAIGVTQLYKANYASKGIYTNRLLAYLQV